VLHALKQQGFAYNMKGTSENPKRKFDGYLSIISMDPLLTIEIFVNQMTADAPSPMKFPTVSPNLLF
jgi:hypothetical protein